jgi:hypothetical protein
MREPILFLLTEKKKYEAQSFFLACLLQVS